MIDWQVWGPGIAVLLGSGTVAVAAALARGRGAKPVESDVIDVRRLDLAERKDTLYRMLGDLHDRRSAIGEVRYLARRDALELEAARTLQQLSEQQAQAAQAASAGRGAEAAGQETAGVGSAAAPSAPVNTEEAIRRAARAGMLRGLRTGIGVAAFFGVLVFLLIDATRERGDGVATGGPLSNAMRDTRLGDGSQGMGGANTGAGAPAHPGTGNEDPQVHALRQQLRMDPENIELKNQLAHEQLRVNDFMGAWQTSQEVLAVNPSDPDALTHAAVVRLVMGQRESARELLDQALAEDPTNLEAMTYAGAVALEESRFDDAIATWQEVIALDPTAESHVGPLIQRAQQLASGADVTPLAPPAATTPAPSSEGPTMAGRIELPAGTPVDGRTLFVIGRLPGVAVGPPVAVRRLVVAGEGSFPLEFSLGPEDVMMSGTPFPEVLDVSVRLDRDGNAMTREPGELIASAPGARAAQPIVMTLEPSS